MQETSTKPYLLRALYEWCTDNGYTPHIAVRVDNSTRVPRQYVRDGEIVLNISFEATSALQMGNEWIEFTARFSGKAHKLEVPVANVLAIYARENGQGMAFQVDATADEPGESAIEDDVAEAAPASADEAARESAEPSEGADVPASSPDDDGGASGKSNRPRLKIVK
ncbi:ClpXP protease specificity-enhancing factor [Burkholderia gladioli]|uniref:ClpXP protease specificity-enhancing factor n=1 Tax=Burkholderia gladioli TaxID=28095 RepID=A0AB38TRP9_BURGA|nr:ClpXP protease specificity-enhancing factor [Burkholderia gladioli]MBU9270123.1 ClpXP protease specificity-enhancing factor [Burkholderia gladioli]MBU9275834.1 ClpXP protease specificity-enhancing factor [Burkholderia gladioli]MBU9324358.1 ClpXP protease specificity-enhancing factor [Burkholderia gladioli]PRE32264.1 ClpXP protease specificity-enhancing factor [Burkholderia gladioli]UWX70580.1 ClpXP protease specificity-enhancing factor [Burkholderia gladioli]